MCVSTVWSVAAWVALLFCFDDVGDLGHQRWNEDSKEEADEGEQDAEKDLLLQGVVVHKTKTGQEWNAGKKASASEPARFVFVG